MVDALSSSQHRLHGAKLARASLARVKLSSVKPVLVRIRPDHFEMLPTGLTSTYGSFWLVDIKLIPVLSILE